MKVKSKIFYGYAACVIAYALLTLLPSPATATIHHYHLSALAIRLLELTLIVPLALIWFAAFYGYERLRAYQELVGRDTKDGQQINKITWGLFALAIGFPLNSIIAEILNIIARHHPSFLPAATILQNYVSIVYPLVAFILISLGARGLSSLVKSRPSPLAVNVVAISVIVLGVVFCLLLANARQSIASIYHLSYAVVMLSLAIPFMYTWVIGLLAAAELLTYTHKVRGAIYRRSWRWVAFGLAGIVFETVLIQYIGALNHWVTNLSLSGILLLLYVLLFLLAVTYIVVALGTKQLIRIEEV